MYTPCLQFRGGPTSQPHLYFIVFLSIMIQRDRLGYSITLIIVTAVSTCFYYPDWLTDIHFNNLIYFTLLAFNNVTNTDLGLHYYICFYHHCFLCVMFLVWWRTDRPISWTWFTSHCFPVNNVINRVLRLHYYTFYYYCYQCYLGILPVPGGQADLTSFNNLIHSILLSFQ